MSYLAFSSCKVRSFLPKAVMSRLTRREELEFMCESRAIRCAIYRGGTSRGVYFLDNDLPYPQTIRAQILLNILGSPDPRQVDGLGGGTSATSKTMIIGPSRLEGTDVEMLFGQVSLNSPIVDWRGTCGNLTTAVGPFAIDQGLVKAIEPITEVAIYSLNTRKRIIARVPVNRGARWFRATTRFRASVARAPGLSSSMSTPQDLLMVGYFLQEAHAT